MYFFYAYQHFLVIFLDCITLALHTACKNSLSSYQTMGSRNSRVFKFGQTVAETQDLLTDTEWEASASPSTAETNLPVRWPTWPPLQPEQSCGQHRQSHVPCRSHCSCTACFPSLSSLLTGIRSHMGTTKAANAYGIWTNCTAIQRHPYPRMQHVNPHIHQTFHERCTSSEMNTNFKNTQTW